MAVADSSCTVEDIDTGMPDMAPAFAVHFHFVAPLIAAGEAATVAEAVAYIHTAAGTAEASADTAGNSWHSTADTKPAGVSEAASIAAE